MDLFSTELVSRASFKCYPNSSNSFLPIFYQNKYILKENGLLS